MENFKYYRNGMKNYYWNLYGNSIFSNFYFVYSHISNCCWNPILS